MKSINIIYKKYIRGIFKSGVIFNSSTILPILRMYGPMARTQATLEFIIELLFVFVEAVFVAPRSEELGIAT